MLLDDLHNKKQIIEQLATSYGAKRIRVFGSVARREERQHSDIDFLVEFPIGYNLFKQRMPLTAELAQLTGRAVDLIPEHELNRHISAYVLQEAVYL